MALRTLSPLFVVALLCLAPSSASAGGFYLLERGSGPLGRGGATIAGIEDPHAIWLNPAGLAYSGDQLLIDTTLTFFEATYTRIDSGGTTLPPVSGHHPYVPIPTIAGSFSFDELPHFTFGVGLFAPNAVLPEWPQSVDGGPAPQRYSMLSLEGSVLSTLALSAAWRPIEELSIGLTTHLLFGNFDARVALSACDGVICSFPEDPEYDAIAQISLPVVYPIFALGTVVDLDMVKIGFSVSTPFNLEGSALIQVRTPAASAFQGAEVVNRRAGCNHANPEDPCRGDTRADVQLEFPWIVRFGVEVEPVTALKLEASVVWETWSLQDEARIRPTDVWIEDALGGALDYQVGPMNIPRYMNDTVSVRVGGQYTFDRLLTLRVGGYWENGAFSDPYLTVLTIDSDKVVASAGVGIHVSPEWTIDVAAGYLWMAGRQVRDSAVPQANPIRPPAPMDEVVYVGNGDYSMTAPFVGLGLRWQGDAGNIRGPGEEREPAPEPEPLEESIEEPESPPVDAATPWYLQGQSDEPASQAAPEPEAPSVDASDEEEERPRRRRRRRRR